MISRTTTRFSSLPTPRIARLALMEDDRGGEERARDAVVGDGEAAAGNVGALQLSFAGAAGEVVELGADLLQAKCACVLHDGNDEALLPERRADADVDRRRDRDPVFLPAAVDRRRDRHRLGRGLHDVSGIAELHAASGHRRLVRGDSGKIRLEQRRDMRRIADRPDHVLGNRHPHAIVRNVLCRELPRLRGRLLAEANHCRGCDCAIDVFAGHPAVAACPSMRDGSMPCCRQARRTEGLSRVSE